MSDQSWCFEIRWRSTSVALAGLLEEGRHRARSSLADPRALCHTVGTTVGWPDRRLLYWSGRRRPSICPQAPCGRLLTVGFCDCCGVCCSISTAAAR